MTGGAGGQDAIVTGADGTKFRTYPGAPHRSRGAPRVRTTVNVSSDTDRKRQLG
jgi:hypothetical protein